MNTTVSTGYELSAEQVSFFRAQGYLIVPGLFAPAEVAELTARFQAMADGTVPVPADAWPRDPNAADPLERFPRIMMPHRFDDLSKRWLLDERVHDILVELLETEPVAAQTMFYWKPPGARGQAMHQDNFYLAVKPGSCIAAWTALDPAAPENGGLFVVPETQDLAVQCPEKADETESFFRDLVKPPPGKKAVPAALQPGDTLFFNGSVIHGSGPNRSPAMWRRSFICHYVPRTTEYVHKNYFPLLDFHGQEVAFQANEDGGPCGNGWRPSSYAA